MSGEADPEAAARWVLSRPGTMTRWAVVKLGADGAIICVQGEGGVVHRVPGFKVGGLLQHSHV